MLNRLAGKWIQCLFLIFFLVGICSLPVYAHTDSTRERIGILAFSGARDDEYRRVAVGELTKVLMKFDRYQLIERVDIDKILAEQQFQISNLMDPVSTVDVGKILGIRLAFIGAIDELDATAKKNRDGEVTGYSASARVTVKMIDVASGRILNVIHTRGSSYDLGESSALHSALRGCFGYEMSSSIRTNIFPFCWILKVDGDRIYLDHGRDLALRVGMRYSVVRPFPVPGDNGRESGTENPETFKRQIAYAEIEEVNDDRAMAKVIWSDGPVTQTDFLEEDRSLSREQAGINVYTTRSDLRQETFVYELCYTSSLPYSGYFKGSLGFAPLVDELLIINLGLQIGWEKPIIPGAVYFTPFVGFGISNCYQSYDDGVTSGLADAINYYNPYVTGGVGLKLYLNHENGPQIQISAVGQLGPYYLGWWDINDREYEVTDYVRYPFFGVAGVGLQLTLTVPIEAPQTTNYAEDLLDTFKN